MACLLIQTVNQISAPHYFLVDLQYNGLNVPIMLQSLNARSRAILMQKLDRSGSASRFVFSDCCILNCFA